jgi:ribosomal protein S18 acetylase RimI-like enzyme
MVDEWTRIKKPCNTKITTVCQASNPVHYCQPPKSSDSQSPPFYFQGGSNMLTMEAANNEHYEELLDIVYSQGSAWLRPIIDLTDDTPNQFSQFFKTVGQVYRLCNNNFNVGMCWVEERGPILELKGIIIKEYYRGQGFGSQALQMLEQKYSGRVHWIELWVHRSNPRAKMLYERTGYKTIKEYNGFFIMQKDLMEEAQEQPYAALTV